MTEIEFIKERLKQSDFPNISFENTHIEYTNYILKRMFKEQYLDNLKYRIETKNFSFDVILEYNPNIQFDYFTYQRVRHDGTLLFEFNAIIECIKKVILAETYNIKIGEPYENCTIKYTIGNLLICNEYGEQFATKEKPWMQQCTTVFLPVKYEII